MRKDFDFAHKQNVEYFRKKLAAATDEKERKVLSRLLAEELAKDTPPQAE